MNPQEDSLLFEKSHESPRKNAIAAWFFGCSFAMASLVSSYPKFLDFVEGHTVENLNFLPLLGSLMQQQLNQKVGFFLATLFLTLFSIFLAYPV
jgi:hypothetical protein